MTGKIDISPEQLAIVQGILKAHLPKGTLAWAFGSRVTWTAKPFSDLDIALEGTAPLAPDVLIDLEEAFEASDLPWKVDVIDLNAVSPEFRAIVERQRVPADWEEVTLQEIIDIKHGYAFKGEYFRDAPPGDVLLTPGNFAIGGGFQLNKLKYYDGPSVPDFTLEGGELLVTMTDLSKAGDTLGFPAIVPSDERVFLHNQRLGKVLIKRNDVDQSFVYWLMRTAPYRNEVLGSCTGSTVKHTSPKRIQAFRFLMPTEAERTAIVRTLSALDDKIELNRRMNETLEAMARAVFRDWFVDFGPTRRKAAGVTDPTAILGGLLPDPTQAQPLAALFPDSFADNGLPEGWEERPFVGFLDIIGGGTPKTKVPEYWGGEVPWFSVVDTPPKGGVFVWNTEKTITERGVAESSVRMIDAGNTIISARGTVGNIAMAARPMTFNQSCYALRAVEPVGDIFVYLATERMVERLKTMAHGSVFSTITRATFESLNFAWAGEDVFAAFEGLIEQMFELIKANGQENQTLAATRDLLLPKLMSGDLRLTGAEGVV